MKAKFVKNRIRLINADDDCESHVGDSFGLFVLFHLHSKKVNAWWKVWREFFYKFKFVDYPL